MENLGEDIFGLNYVADEYMDGAFKIINSLEEAKEGFEDLNHA